MPPFALAIKIREMEAKAAADAAAERDPFNAFAKADLALMELAKVERAATGDTRLADKASRELNRLMSLTCELENKLAAIREMVA
jgi:hypothetical protein